MTLHKYLNLQTALVYSFYEAYCLAFILSFLSWECWILQWNWYWVNSKFLHFSAAHGQGQIRIWSKQFQNICFSINICNRYEILLFFFLGSNTCFGPFDKAIKILGVNYIYSEQSNDVIKLILFCSTLYLLLNVESES